MDRFRDLLESAGFAVWEADARTRRYTYVSRVVETLLGYGVEAWTAEPEFWIQSVHPEDRERVGTARRAQVAAGRKHQLEYRMVRADGETVWVRETVQVAAGIARGVLVDISAQRKLEEELRRSQKGEAVGQLAGGLAHDFNNLLAAITGYSDLLLASLEPEDSRRADAEEIHKAAERAARLTRQLLAFSRKQVLQSRVLDLNQVVRDMEKMLGGLLGKRVRLATRTEASSARVRADTVQLEQVLLNLALNARDAMPRGGVLTLGTADVEIAAKPGGLPAGSYVVLEVIDTGTGMDAQTQARLFEPFFTTKGQGQGTGLGLSTVHRIIEQSGGHLEVSSKPGHGSTFRIYLPLAKEDDSTAPRP